MKQVYMDYNATSPVRPEVRHAMLAAMSFPANPSSMHQAGQMARQVLQKSRENIASFMGAAANQLLFCSSGTEANNWLLSLFADKLIAVSAIEHDSVLKVREDALIIPVDQHGVVDLAGLEALLAEHRPALVSVMLVNNETGVMQPLQEIATLAHKYDADVHTDAAQAFGKMPVSFKALGVDHMTFCAHKVGGPVGFGGLITNLPDVLPSALIGGMQENRRRGGTENIAAISGVSRLVDMLRAGGADEQDSLRHMREQLENGLVASGAIIFGADANRASNTVYAAMPGVPAQTQLMHFDLSGVQASAGAACSSGKIAPSHVLQAMGYDKQLAGSAVRFSIGWQTTEADVRQAINAWQALYNRHHAKVAA